MAKSSNYKVKIAVEAQTEEIKKVSEAVDEINTAVQKASESSSAFSRVLSGSFYEVGASITRVAEQIPAAVMQTIKAFGAQEAAVQKVATAIRSQGGSVSEVLPIMQQLASDIQKITTYGDEQVLAMQAMASGMGVTATQMQACIEGAIGLSNAFGLGLNEAVKAAAAVIQGKTEKLNELIPTLSQCTSAEERLTLAQKAMRDGFAQAQAESETLNGKLQQAANAWGDLQEVIGEAFAPTAKAVAASIKFLCEMFTEFSGVTKVLTMGLTSLAVGLAFQKVGGLLGVANNTKILSAAMKSYTGATKAATTATISFSAALRANPVGVVATAISLAVFAIGEFIDYLGKATEAEQKEMDVANMAREARRKNRADTKAANIVLEEHANKLKLAGETAEETATRINKLSEEIKELSDRSKWEDGEQEKNARLLVAKKQELVKAQELYLERLHETSKAEFQFESKREAVRRLNVEQELNAARKTGIAHIIAFKESELDFIKGQEKEIELKKQFYEINSGNVKTEKDRIDLMEKAEKYAKSMVEQYYATASAEKWLVENTTRSKSIQRDLEFKILQARSQGNEVLAKENEGELRIAQLTSEIFENTRKEGMSKEELINLLTVASEQAKKRFDMEKSITEEAQRQNLAKNAQAQIEDILLTNKIEQLKAEGKLDAAKALEQERDIKRATAALGDTVSDEDKEKLGNVMRQTNEYRAQQDENRAGEFGESSGGYSVGAGDSANDSVGGRGASYSVGRSYGNGSFGSSFAGGGVASMGGRRRGATPPRRAATVSEKYAGLYAEYQVAKKAGKATDGWIAFRDKRIKENQKNSGQNEKNGQKANLEKGARKFMGKVTDVAEGMSTSGLPKPQPKPQLKGELKKTSDKVENKKISETPKKLKNDNKSSDKSKKEAPRTRMQRKLEERNAFANNVNGAKGGTLEQILVEVKKINRGVRVQAEV